MAKPHRLEGLPASAQTLAREANAALMRGRFDDAERHITAMLAYAPTHPEPQRLLGLLLLRSGRAADAVKALREADAQQPDDPDILIPLGAALSDAGEFAAAIEPLRRAVELRPDAETMYRYGRMLEQNAQYEQSIPAFRRALEIDPKHEQARLQYARGLFYTGHADEAANAVSPSDCVGKGCRDGMARTCRNQNDRVRRRRSRRAEKAAEESAFRRTRTRDIAARCRQSLRRRRRFPRRVRCV